MGILLNLIFITFWPFASIFPVCEFGRRFEVSSRFEEINDATHQFDWYSFPIEIQNMLPIVYNILNVAQQPVVFQGFGNIVCTLDSFKRVNFTP